METISVEQLGSRIRIDIDDGTVGGALSISREAAEDLLRSLGDVLALPIGDPHRIDPPHETPDNNHSKAAIKLDRYLESHARKLQAMATGDWEIDMLHELAASDGEIQMAHAEAICKRKITSPGQRSNIRRVLSRLLSGCNLSAKVTVGKISLIFLEK